jgi:copper chaperone CopZ
MERIKLSIAGMSCGHCVSAVRNALTEKPGVEIERLEIGSANVAYDEGRYSAADIIRAVEEAGYTAQVAA